MSLKRLRVYFKIFISVEEYPVDSWKTNDQDNLILRWHCVLAAGKQLLKRHRHVEPIQPVRVWKWNALLVSIVLSLRNTCVEPRLRIRVFYSEWKQDSAIFRKSTSTFEIEPSSETTIYAVDHPGIESI